MTNKKRGWNSHVLVRAVFAGGALTSRALLAQVPVTLGTSQTVGSLYTAPLTIDASVGVVDITQTTGTTIRLFDGGISKLGNYTASLAGGRIISDAGEIDLDSVGGDFTLGSALDGSSLALVKTGAGRVILTSTSAGTHTFAGGVYLSGGAIQISSDANLGANAGNDNSVFLQGGSLEIGANLNFASTRTINVGIAGGTLAVTNAAFVATIDDTNQLAGSGSLVKEGPGALRITSSNVISGSISVNGGVLELRNTGALTAPASAKAPITLNSTGRLNLRHDGPFPANFGNDITVAGNSTIDVGSVSTGTSGNVQLGALNLGNATLTVSGSNRSLEFTNTTTVAGDATIDNAIDVRLGGQLTGNGSLTKRGGGVLSLSGIAPNTYSDLTTVLGGTLELGKTAGSNAVPGDLIINGGTVRLVTPGQIADNSVITLTTGGLELNNQTDSVSVLHNDGGVITTGTGSLLVTSPNTTILAAGSTIINPGGRLDSVGLIIIGGTNEAQPGGTISVGTAGFTMQGNSSPTVLLDAGSATSGVMLMRSNTSFTGTAGTAQILNSGASPLAGVVDLGGATRIFTINNGTAAADMVVSAQLTNGGLTKSGAGVLRLTRSNTYAGGTTLAGGTLEINDGAALGTGSVLFQGGALSLRSDASTFVCTTPLSAGAANLIALDYGRQTAGSAGAFSVPSATLGTALTVVGNDGGTFAVNGPVNLQASVNVTTASVVNFNGVVSQITGGLVGITKSGTGTLIIGGSGNNSYQGNSTLNSGVMLLAKSSGIALPTNVTINGPSLLKLNASEQIADSANVNFNNALGTASLDLNGQTETVGGITGNGSLLLGSGQLYVANASSNAFSGTISGSGRLNKSGNGELILSGNSAFTGGASVSAGTLTFQTSAPGHVGSTLTSGVWQVSGGATLNFATGANITSNQASVTLSGPSASFAKFNFVDTNSGTFAVTDGGTFTTAAGLNNTGTVIVGGGLPGSVVTIPGTVSGFSGNTLSTGNWIVQSGGALVFGTGGNINTNAANVTLSGIGSVFTPINSMTSNTGRFTVSAGRTFTTTGALSNSGTLAVGSSSVLKTSGNLTNTGTLDIGGGVIIESTSGSPISTIRSQLQTGFASGAWDGPGINSTRVRSTLTGPRTALGYADASALSFNSFMNVSASSTSVLIGYTYAGDADLNGTVNTLDFTRLSANFNTTGKFWTQGDFNYDGKVNLLDFNALAIGFGASITLNGAEIGLGSLVPEPVTAVPSAIAMLAFASRRRRS